MSLEIGQRVYFGRMRGELSLGEVVKINAKSIKIKLLESRGTFKAHTVGGIWRVHPSLCYPA